MKCYIYIPKVSSYKTAGTKKWMNMNNVYDIVFKVWKFAQ